VSEVVDAFTRAFGGRPGWVEEKGTHLREAQLLTLSAERARAAIGWRPALSFEKMVEWTAAWHRAHQAKADMRGVTEEQIACYADRLTASSAAAERERAHR
jgi:CDP-glucose 4,6-dehydratase